MFTSTGFCMFLLSVFILCTRGTASLPEHYGAAQVLEDTGRVSLTVSLFDTTHNNRSTLLWNTSLYTSEVTIGRIALSGKTGCFNTVSKEFTPALQELMLTIPVRKSTIQIGAGYQPQRLQEVYHVTSEINGNDITKENLFCNLLNKDRYVGRLNGFFTIDSARKLLWGAEVQVETRSGANVARMTDYTLDYDRVSFKECQKSDGIYSAEIGVGYWKNVRYRHTAFKTLLLLEGAYHKEKQALRFNQDIIPYLLSLQPENSRYQYKVDASGYILQNSGIRLRYILSSRYFPLLPDDTKDWWLSGGMEQISFALGILRESNVSCYYEKSNTHPDGFSLQTVTMQQWGPSTCAEHSWRLFLRTPWCYPDLHTSLFGRIEYYSNGIERTNGSNRMATWYAVTDLWLGACALLFKRLFLELSYKTATTSSRVQYSQVNDMSKSEINFDYDIIKKGRWFFGLRLVR